MIKQYLSMVALSLFGTSVLAADLAGTWKHDEQPVWVEVSKEGEVASGTVLRNDNKPDAVGAVFLRDVKSAGEKGSLWKGQVYAAALGEFKDAEISLPTGDTMKIKVKVGFMSRSVTWSRVESVPES